MSKGRNIVWLGSVVIAFGAGYLLHSPEANTQTQDSLSQQSLAKTLPLEQNKINAPLTPSKNKANNSVTPANIGNTPVSVDEVVEHLQNTLQDNFLSMDIGDLANAYNLIKNLDEDQLRSALSEFSTTNSDKNNMAIMLLLGQYAGLNPENALAYVENNLSSPFTKQMALSTVISKWAKKNVDEAYDWYKNQLTSEKNSKNDNFNNTALVSIFNQLAKHDVNDAIAKLGDLKAQGKHISMAVMGIVSSLKNADDYAAVLNQIDSIDDKTVKNQIVATWARKKPAEAALWVDSVTNDEQKQTLQQRVFSAWSSTEPEKAANWYINNATEENKQEYVENIARTWSYRDPEQALIWLSQQSNVDTSQATNKLVSNSVYRDTQFAIDNIELISSKKEKQATAVAIYNTLKRKSQREADEYLASSAYKDHIEKYLDRIKKYNKKR